MLSYAAWIQFVLFVNYLVEVISFQADTENSKTSTDHSFVSDPVEL